MNRNEKTINEHNCPYQSSACISCYETKLLRVNKNVAHMSWICHQNDIFWKTRDSQPKASCHLSLGFQGWARVDPTSPSSWYARSTISLAESEGLVLSVRKFGAASVGSFWWLQIHRSGTCNDLWKTYHGKGNVSFIFKGLCPNISNISEA